MAPSRAADSGRLEAVTRSRAQTRDELADECRTFYITTPEQEFIVTLKACAAGYGIR